MIASAARGVSEGAVEKPNKGVERDVSNGGMDSETISDAAAGSTERAFETDAAMLVDLAAAECAAEGAAAKGVGGFDEAAFDPKRPVDEAAGGIVPDAIAPVGDKPIDDKAPNGAAIDKFPGFTDSEIPMQIDLPGTSFSHLGPIAEFHFTLSRRHQ